MNDNEMNQIEVKIKDLENAKAQAEYALSKKTQFLANVSHELRTPLGVILGLTELALDKSQSTAERETYLHTIKRNGEQLLELINELLDLSKIDAGCIDLEERDFSLSEMLKDLHDSFRMSCEEKGIAFGIRAEGPVPAFLKSDSQRIRQVLMNLLGNATKFTDRGTIDLVVKATPTSDEAKINLLFEVTDTGAGISPLQREKLFQLFSQCDAGKKSRARGSGLGLALSRKIANALGGDVYLKESTPDVGSTFVFRLNDQRRPESSQPLNLDDPPIHADPTVADPSLNGVRVLLAEDAPEIQLIVTRYLERAGADVDVVDNGIEAIQRAHGEHFDVVLMDLQMPLLNGYDATERLRTLGFDRPIIALTAYAMPADRDRCLRKGFDDHLSKPVDRHLLLSEVKEYALKPGRVWTH